MTTKKTTKKTVKKAAVKKAPAAKTAVKTAPVAAAPVCACDAKCCGGKFRWVKKALVLVLVFALGYAACFFCPKKMGRMMMWKFDSNGCLMVEKIKCQAMAQRVAAADLNNDGCITRKELREWKKSFKSEKGGCPFAAQQQEEPQPRPMPRQRRAPRVQQ
ncbi:MAG: hypothetical protein FWG39_03630 [Alphaproteobacteria bacterium]|nr:hypothetical protein [Alphaproteobacteria bacterium]